METMCLPKEDIWVCGICQSNLQLRVCSGNCQNLICERCMVRQCPVCNGCFCQSCMSMMCVNHCLFCCQCRPYSSIANHEKDMNMLQLWLDTNEPLSSYLQEIFMQLTKHNDFYVDEEGKQFPLKQVVIVQKQQWKQGKWTNLPRSAAPNYNVWCSPYPSRKKYPLYVANNNIYVSNQDSGHMFGKYSSPWNLVACDRMQYTNIRERECNILMTITEFHSLAWPGNKRCARCSIQCFSGTRHCNLCKQTFCRFDVCNEKQQKSCHQCGKWICSLCMCNQCQCTIHCHQCCVDLACSCIAQGMIPESK